MREILFRAKRVDNAKWVEGSLLVTVLNTYIVPFHDDTVMSQRAYSVFPETVGQFTGLTDKNGEKIFDGDKFGNENMPVRHVVFEDGKFCFNRVHSQGADALSQDRVGRLVIIGNIHD